MFFTTNCVYSEQVANCLGQDYPDVPVMKESCLTDTVTKAIVGTKQTRQGSSPDSGSLDAIRRVVAECISQSRPIPFMVPWGSEKPNGASIDVAEVCALKTINSLQRRVCALHSPGIICNIRLEDVSAPHLFFEDQETARRNALQYSNDFTTLASVMEIESFVKIVRESALATEETFNETADEILPVMESYLLNPNQGMVVLAAIGWSGNLSPVIVDYYLGQYHKLYPTKSLREKIHILARYFSGALARAKLKLRGDDPEWRGEFIDLAFIGPIPGTESRFNRRLYYRTLPKSLSSKHLPAWRAKGYVNMSGTQARPSLTSFREQLPLKEMTLVASGAGQEVQIRADYLCS